jgi:hypothetical protein
MHTPEILRLNQAAQLQRQAGIEPWIAQHTSAEVALQPGILVVRRGEPPNYTP